MSDVNDFNQQVIDEFRANDGKVGGMFQGAPMLLLTTKGAKSGQPRVAPLVYSRDGDRYVVIASKGGAPTNPDWYHNIAANPDITVEIGSETFPAHAEIAAEPERTRLFDAHAALMPGFRDYQNNTSRIIPVVTISRA
ncbi:MAG: nitroreductase family deazaflavin-dependent oxidoreductase [Thermomicrobiales bacterium]|nr:nitroreductase family deazaflavin-dependent oxidoreductase [Thermomicrobiales bacterium]MCA9880919.1 nitroreductase family deazaflavin-dependent oxidoreductase [Thermomicrobiales bacterium]